MKCICILSLFLFTSLPGFSQGSQSSSNNIVLGPYTYYFSDQQPADLSQPLVHGSANGCADEGRVVNIKLTAISGPINVTPDHADITGPPCPTYDAHGNRNPVNIQPPDC